MYLTSGKTFCSLHKWRYFCSMHVYYWNPQLQLSSAQHFFGPDKFLHFTKRHLIEKIKGKQWDY